jgi:putative sugar O-methyltransferase
VSLSSGQGTVSSGESSLFWRDLAERQRAELAAHGADTFKRNVALRHFSWRWHWRSLWRSEQARFLLAHSKPRDLRRAFAEPMDLADDSWAGVDWSRADRRLYTVAIRLLWAYAQRSGDPDVVALPEPAAGSPLPVSFGGRLISQDLANSAIETAAIGRALAKSSPGRILEIGAGYGRTAYGLLSKFPDARYTIVDIEPAISLSRAYLSDLFASDRLEFLAPEELSGVSDGSIDLAVSISSLQELTDEQTKAYVAEINRVATGGSVYLKQWRRWRNPVDCNVFEFSQLPIPAAWKLMFSEAAPVQTRFMQAGWRIP